MDELEKIELRHDRDKLIAAISHPMGKRLFEMIMEGATLGEAGHELNLDLGGLHYLARIGSMEITAKMRRFERLANDQH